MLQKHFKKMFYFIYVILYGSIYIIKTLSKKYFHKSFPKHK